MYQKRFSTCGRALGPLVQERSNTRRWLGGAVRSCVEEAWIRARMVYLDDLEGKSPRLDFRLIYLGCNSTCLKVL